MMTNLDLSQKIFEFLKQADVETIVVCAGARNAALVVALRETNFHLIHFFEERSAAFFSLGLIKATTKPVAIVTTSGTAVGELLPSAIEATYQGLPLIIITADRPRTYRNTGAPQAIEQVGIFTHYVESAHDLDVNSVDFSWSWSLRKPIHLNVCFDEPLMDQASDAGNLNPVRLKIHTPKSQTRMQSRRSEESAKDQIRIGNPLIILSALEPRDVPAVKKFLQGSNAIFYMEPLSQLANDPQWRDRRILSSEVLVKRAFQEKTFDSVIRVGGVPTLRFWRDLEKEFAGCPVYSFSDLAFTGLARPSEIFELARLEDVRIQVTKAFDLTRDYDLQCKKLSLLEMFPLSEPACVKHFSEALGDAAVYLGNSLPIRHWDSFASSAAKNLYANRGANGIDGQVSTYLGWSEAVDESYAFIGDLTALYDLASLGLTEQLKKNRRRVAVLNNFGGQIFQRVFKNDLFTNPHKIEFKNWAQMWNWGYLLIKTQDEFKFLNSDLDLNVVIEIQPDPQQTKLFWDEWDQLCRKI